MSQGRTYGPPDVSAYCAWLGLGTEAPPGIRLNVVFTTREGTLAALMTASTLAPRNLQAAIRVLIAQVVPFALPLDRPPVSPSFFAQLCRGMAARCEEAAELTVEVYLCRCRRRALRHMLTPHSLVVVGGKKRWWRTREQKLARMLSSDGHDVIFVDVRHFALPKAVAALEEPSRSATDFLPKSSRR
ncbi:MAG: hypothetical protein ACRD3O_02615 [Terriglobia bacterium]